MIPSQIWPAHRMDELRRLMASGMTSGMVAKIMKITRSAVIGKASRMGLKWETPPAVKDTTKRPKREPLMDRMTKERIAAKAKGQARIAAMVIVEWTREPIAIADLEPHNCRWPVNAWPEGKGHRAKLCGAPKVEGSVYCGKHHSVAYLPARNDRLERLATRV